MKCVFFVLQMDGMKPIGATDQSELPKDFKLGRVSNNDFSVLNIMKEKWGCTDLPYSTLHVHVYQCSNNLK